jgi:hypothetical protein
LSPSPGYGVLRRTTVAEVERQHSPPGSDFERVEYPTYVMQPDAYADWQALRSLLQPGDELWEFSTDQESWNGLAGRAGLCVVREGKAAGALITMLN